MTTNDPTRKQDVAQRGREAAEDEARSRSLWPAVDIFEDGDAVHVLADVPGVSIDTLNVEVDGDLLTLEGDIQVEMPQGMTASHAEVRGSRYFRQFRLGREVNADEIRAAVTNGVLDLVLPKHPSQRRRRIEVSGG